ncbi:box C/D snoRNA protein 1-like [Pollicipes pollicipes]|uniref:box C/D snoRNA protein 1-like n=1 Tax=Pollicipes pollicipes TaxID=41117 RepID=UPI0018851292|nr:box C/D snoRNA protein 1-like [Pollicipes pollicipes]
MHRRGVRLDFLPEGFGRRLENTSQLEADTGCLLWRVEWRLPLADAVRTDDRVPDTSRLSEVLARHLSDALAPEDPLQFYRAALESRAVYIELPVNKTLEACLKDRLVIEFPILVVTTEEHAVQYREDVIEGAFEASCGWWWWCGPQ